MTQPQILIACIGNIFMGDDGFGVAVAERLLQRTWPAEVRIVDFGIRGLDLAYALLDEQAVTILVDATPRGEAPGTLYVLELDVSELANEPEAALMIEPHGLNPMRVLRLAKSLGAQFHQILLVGCEPETLGPEEGQLGLSATVEAVLEEAANLIESLVTTTLAQRSRAA